MFENVKKEIEAFGEYAIEVIPAGRPEIKDYVSTIARMLDAAKTEMEAELSRLRERNKSIEEQHERIVENLRQERDAASEKLDEILMHAPHHKTIPGDDDVERVKNALERYSDLVTFLEDHADLTSAELLGSFDLKIRTVGEWLDDYDKAIETLAEARDGSTTKLERGDLGGALKTYCDEHDGDAVKKADAIRVVEAATELLRDLEWQRPNPYPLADLRDALRTYHGKDDVRAPSLPGVE